MPSRSDYRPTHGAPHRWCWTLHAVAVALCLPAVLIWLTGSGLPQGIPIRLAMLTLSAGVVALLLALFGVDGPRHKHTGTMSVRPGWAKVCAATDLVVLVAAVYLFTDAVVIGTGTTHTSTSGWLAPVIAWVISGLHTVAHHKSVVRTPTAAEKGKAPVA